MSQSAVSSSQNTPAVSTPSVPSPSPTPHILEPSLLSMQIRAFLMASEDIEADADIMHDLFSTLVEAGPDDATQDVDIEWDDETESHMELDISALYSNESLKAGFEEWPPAERARMMHHLKEHGSSSFVQKYVISRNIPIPRLLTAFGVYLCPELRDKQLATMLFFLRVAMSRELSLRDKNPDLNTLDDAVSLIRDAKRMIILTGAGISVSCGIPDFRSKDGLYASLKDGRAGNYDLDDPQQMFDINYFRENPSVFYSFANQIYPSNFTPSPCHRFIKLIEDKGKLLRNYTQNIDTLETQAGVRNVLQCHGSFATATCIECRVRVLGKEIEEAVMARRVPLCKVCNVTTKSKPEQKRKRSKKRQMGKWDSDDEDLSEDGGIELKGVMKPDITFFGEKLKDDFDKALEADRDKVDLLLVIGTSLKVAPVSDLLTHLPHSVPQILINKTPVSHINPDIILLGDADVIVQDLCDRLAWTLPSPVPPSANNASTPSMPSRPQRNLSKRSASSNHSSPSPPLSAVKIGPKRVGDTHIWLFEGAEGGGWLKEIERHLGLDGLDASTGGEVPKDLVQDGNIELEAASRPVKRARVGA